MAEVDSNKAALIAEIEVSRAEIRTAIRRIETDLDVVESARKSISHNLGRWLVGATFGGLFISQFLARRKTLPTLEKGPALGPPDTKRWFTSGLAISLAKITFDLIKPALFELVKEKLTLQSPPPSKHR